MEEVEEEEERFAVGAVGRGVEEGEEEQRKDHIPLVETVVAGEEVVE